MYHLANLAAFADDGTLTVVVETPKGSRNKLSFVPEGGYFELGGPLPLGAVFPFDFGFVPGTIGGDDDPLDVLLLLEGGAYPGVVVRARLVGVIEAEQAERDGETMRNDRLIAVAEKSRLHGEIRELRDLPSSMLDEIEHFFTSYNELKGKTFTPTARRGAAAARKLVERSLTTVPGGT